MPFCPNCGKEVSEDAKFCPGCGQRIGGQQEPTPDNHKMDLRRTAKLQEDLKELKDKSKVWSITGAVLVIVGLAALPFMPIYPVVLIIVGFIFAVRGATYWKKAKQFKNKYF